LKGVSAACWTCPRRPPRGACGSAGILGSGGFSVGILKGVRAACWACPRRPCRGGCSSAGVLGSGGFSEGILKGVGAACWTCPRRPHRGECGKVTQVMLGEGAGGWDQNSIRSLADWQAPGDSALTPHQGPSFWPYHASLPLHFQPHLGVPKHSSQHPVFSAPAFLLLVLLLLLFLVLLRQRALLLALLAALALVTLRLLRLHSRSSTQPWSEVQCMAWGCSPGVLVRCQLHPVRWNLVCGPACAPAAA
jgi:hypothetical protein